MENYFIWNTEEMKSRKIYLLVIYDIVGNKRRTNFAKRMKGYGFRVQKSAFEAMVSENLYRKLLNEIPALIYEKREGVRIYLVVGCREVYLFAQNVSIENEEVIIL